MKRILSVVALACMLVLALCSCQKESRDIRNVEINEDGELILLFTDGTQSSLGRVVGEDGKDGLDGAKGEKGDNGENGKDGINGKNGTNGINGTNGTNGIDGNDGRGIASIEQTEDGKILISYTDNTTETVELALGILGGKCGDSVAWALYTGGILVIDGHGATYDYEQGETPWYSFIDGITAVYVNNIDIILDENLLYGFDQNRIVTPDKIAVSVWVDMTEKAPIRSSADATGEQNILDHADFGSEWKCVLFGETFSEIIYNGGRAYIETQYINTDNGSLVFEEREAEVSVVSSTLNLRTYTDATAETGNKNVYDTVNKNTVLKVTGVSLNKRWIRVDYDGRALYVLNNTSYISNVVE